jgi:hypothetical protein
MSLRKSKLEQDAPPPSAAIGKCRRCHLTLAIDDDGFCDVCRKALEEACL